MTVKKQEYYQAISDSATILDGQSGIAIGFESNTTHFRPGGFVPAVSKGFTVAGWVQMPNDPGASGYWAVKDTEAGSARRLGDGFHRKWPIWPARPPARTHAHAHARTHAHTHTRTHAHTHDHASTHARTQDFAVWHCRQEEDHRTSRL